MSVKVTFARPWTTEDGKEHKPDSTADIEDPGEAERLLELGYARPADKVTAKKTEKEA